MKINKGNYEYYKKLFNLLTEFQFNQIPIIFSQDSPIHPSNVLESFEKESIALAIKGLKEGFPDSLTIANLLSKKQKEELNQILKTNGFPTIEVLNFKIHNTYKRVIKRNRIKNEVEYYIIIEILSDVEYQISTEERLNLNTLISNFESKINLNN